MEETEVDIEQIFDNVISSELVEHVSEQWAFTPYCANIGQGYNVEPNVKVTLLSSQPSRLLRLADVGSFVIIKGLSR